MVEIIREETQPEVQCQICGRLLRYDPVKDVHHDSIWSEEYSIDVPFITCPGCKHPCIVEEPK